VAEVSGLYAFAFVAVFATDIAWVYYLTAVGDKRPWLAALVATALYLAGGLTVLAYIAEPGVLVAGSLGAFAGTALGVWVRGRKGKRA